MKTKKTVILFFLNLALFTITSGSHANEISVSENGVVVKMPNGNVIDTSKQSVHGGNKDDKGVKINAGGVTVDSSTNRVIVKGANGEVIDTANLPKGEEIKEGDGVEINEAGVSIGSVTNHNGEQSNITRTTKLDNVTIINNNGKATIYRTKPKAESKSEQ